MSVKIDDSNESFGSLILDLFDVLWNTNFDDLFTCDILKRFLLFFVVLGDFWVLVFLWFFKFHLFLSIDFVLENEGDISDTLSHFVEVLNSLEMLNYLILCNDWWNGVKILLTQRSDDIIFVDFLVSWLVWTFHTTTHINTKDHRFEAFFLIFVNFSTK